jgi:hypothetical protein
LRLVLSEAKESICIMYFSMSVSVFIDLILTLWVSFVISELLFKMDIGMLDLCNGDLERILFTLIVILCTLVCLCLKVQCKLHPLQWNLTH